MRSVSPKISHPLLKRRSHLQTLNRINLRRNNKRTGWTRRKKEFLQKKRKNRLKKKEIRGMRITHGKRMKIRGTSANLLKRFNRFQKQHPKKTKEMLKKSLQRLIRLWISSLRTGKRIRHGKALPRSLIVKVSRNAWTLHLPLTCNRLYHRASPRPVPRKKVSNLRQCMNSKIRRSSISSKNSR